MICLLIPCVMGRSRVPDPPASTIPFTGPASGLGAAALGDELRELHERLLRRALGEPARELPRQTNLSAHRLACGVEAPVRGRDLERARKPLAVRGALRQQHAELLVP